MTEAASGTGGVATTHPRDGPGRGYGCGTVNETAHPDRGVTDLDRLLLFVSLLGVATFALRIAGVVAVPAVVLVPGLLAYPLGRLLRREYRPSALDALYVATLFLGLGGVLAFSSAHPVGYSDVQRHIAATLAAVADGRLQFAPEISTNFVALYVVVTALAELTGTSVPAVARVFPLVTFVTGLLVFYHGIARRFLDDRAALFAALVFGTNWGVFRFGVEYRTLNVSFFLLLVVTALLVREWLTTHRARENMVVYALLITTLAASHLTTFVFYLVVLTVVVAAFALHRPRRNLLNYLLISVVALFGYVVYVGGLLDSAVRVLGVELLLLVAKLTGETTIDNETSAQGLVGLTYGYNMFLAEWLLRGLFVVAFGLFVLGWLRRRDRFGTVVILASGVLGLFVLGTTLVGTLLNPSRVFTFFALPYALAYAGGLLSAFTNRVEPTGERDTPTRLEPVSRLLDDIHRLLTGRTARNVVRVLVVVVLVVALTSTMLKFPAYIVGDTEPIRTEQPIDDIPYLQFDGYEVTARDFVVTHHRGPVTYAYGEETVATGFFYSSVIEQPDDDVADRLDQFTVVGVEYHTDELRAPTADRVYDNGEVRMYHETAALG